MWTNVVNKFLNVRNKVKNRKGEWVDQKGIDVGDVIIHNGITEIPVNGFTIYESDKPFVLEAFEWGTNGLGTAAPRLHKPNGVSGFNNIFVIVRGDATRTTITRASIASEGSVFFDIRKYDTSTDHYSFSLRRPIIMQTGGRVSIEGLSNYEGGQTVGYHVVIRELD